MTQGAMVLPVVTRGLFGRTMPPIIVQEPAGGLKLVSISALRKLHSEQREAGK